jgi:putative tryptophan/tyrosine transport system substrate-binding protein
MKRRQFITLLSAAAIAWPIAAHAQQSGQTRRLGVLMGSADEPETRGFLTTFLRRLNELGWKEDENIRIDYRWGAGAPDAAPGLAAELVELHPDVILCQSTPIGALRQLTSTIPIVFVQVSDPIRRDIVDSLARPGGNATGFTNFESSMGGKWVNLIKEIVPSTARVALMFNPMSSPHIAAGYYLESAEEASRQFGLEAFRLPVNNIGDIEIRIGDFAGKSNGALVVLPDTFNAVHSEAIIRLTAQHRLPAIYPYRADAARGGLVMYGINPRDQYPRAASYVDRILRGAKPSDLPVQAPITFELVINQKTAKTLGVVVPDHLLALANEVIQ